MRHSCALLLFAGLAACAPGVSSGVPELPDACPQTTGDECDTTYTNPTADLIDLMVVIDRASDVDTNWTDVRSRLSDAVVGYATNRGSKPTSLRVLVGSNGAGWNHFDWESWHETTAVVGTQMDTLLDGVMATSAAPALLELAAQAVGDPTLVREGASRIIVFVTARDDESPTGTDYATVLGMNAPDFIIALVGTSAPIQAVMDQIGSVQSAALTDTSYDSAFYDFIVVTAPRCFKLAVDPTHPDCVVVDTTPSANGSPTTTTLPACGAGVSPPCFQFTSEPKCNAPSLVLTIDRGTAGLAPDGTTTAVQCHCPT